MPMANRIPRRVSHTLSCTSSFSHTSLDFVLFVVCRASAVMSAVNVGGGLTARWRNLAFIRLLLNLLLFRLRRVFLGDGVTAGAVVFGVEGEGASFIAVSTRLF